MTIPTSGVILCFKCHSSHVDVLYWVRQGAITECVECGCKGFISGLSIGRVLLHNEQINQAKKDMAQPNVAELEVQYGEKEKFSS